MRDPFQRQVLESPAAVCPPGRRHANLLGDEHPDLQRCPLQALSWDHRT